MEVFGILFSIPAAFIAAFVYRLLLIEADRLTPWVRLLFVPASYVVLGAFAAELLALSTAGATRCYAVVGPLFFDAHFAVFVLGTPALVNLLVLRWPKAWYVVAFAAAAFALVLVFNQYAVFEELYGVDGRKVPRH